MTQSDDDAGGDAKEESKLELPESKKRKRSIFSRQVPDLHKSLLTEELVQVPCLGDFDWWKQLSKWKKSLFNLQGRWTVKISDSVRQRIQQEFPDFSDA